MRTPPIAFGSRCRKPARWRGSLKSSKPTGSIRRPVSICQTTELASTEAGKIALKGGAADIILSDWLWVARERALGDALVFYPYSSTLGAVMVPAQSSIRTIDDLKGKTIAVAGGPIDKSWLLLQAFARRSGLDLRKQATPVYGAPPLLSQKALQGRDRRDADVLELLRGAGRQRLQARRGDGRGHERPRRKRRGCDCGICL